MPKLKTHKGAAKRNHVTGSGKIMRMHGMKSHFRRRKAARVKRLFDETIQVNRVDERKLRTLMPYSK
jgi:large subunit ribosomal protein L35